VGTEAACDWTIPYADISSPLRPARVVAVPLFNLVYHDAILTTYTAPTVFDDKFLEDLAYGNHHFFAFAKHTYAQQREHIRAVNAIFQPFARAVALDELLDHAYLTDDYAVQRTTFSSGAAAIVNTGRQPYTAALTRDGLDTPSELADIAEVPARGFLLRFPDGRRQVGGIETGVRVEDITPGAG
jgi:hypothetical protein